MEEVFLTTGVVRAVTIEEAELIKSPFSWKEGERRFSGRMIFDPAGKPIEKKENGETVVFRYDTQGLLLKEEVLDGEGQTKTVREHHYDSDKNLRLIREGSCVTVSPLVPAIGQPITEKRFRDDILELVTETVTGPEEKPSLREYRDGSGRFIRRETFEYDNAGRLKSFRCVNDTGTVVTHDLFEYPVEDRGNWLKRIRYAVREEGRRVRETPIEVLYRDIIADPLAPGLSPDVKETGQLIFPDGKYSGEIQNNLMHGYGVLEFNDGSRYEGEFSRGIMEGRGTFLWPDGRHYEGDFRNGKMEGTGFCRWPNGDEYRGAFSGGMMHGIGSFTWKNGTRFTGLFDKNRRTDQGLIEQEKISDGSD